MSCGEASPNNNKMANIFTVLLLLSISGTISSTNCPSISSNTSSCRCSDGIFGKRIICSKLSSELELDRVIRCNNKYHAEEFAINDSELRYINKESFQGSSYELLDIQGTSLMSLTDRRIALVGLEGTLRQITINKCTYVAHWDWSQLKDMKKLEAIEVVGTDIDYPIGFNKLSMSSLRRILMSENNDLTSFPDDAFANLPSLYHLLLSRNSINTISRKMLPNSLQKLDLSHNNIKTLPAGVFSNLPGLISIYLNANKLHTLDEDVFKPVWTQLALFQFKENPLVCDCRLKWVLKESRPPRSLDAHCDTPNHLKGMSITSVKPGELWCY